MVRFAWVNYFFSSFSIVSKNNLGVFFGVYFDSIFYFLNNPIFYVYIFSLSLFLSLSSKLFKELFLVFLAIFILFLIFLFAF